MHCRQRVWVVVDDFKIFFFFRSFKFMYKLILYSVTVIYRIVKSDFLMCTKMKMPMNKFAYKRSQLLCRYSVIEYNHD